jgi:membrane-associated phospholipid phosphatase
MNWYILFQTRHKKKTKYILMFIDNFYTKKIKQYIVRVNFLLCIILFCLIFSVSVQASDNIETAGDVLLVILPAAAAGISIGFKDSMGTLQFGKSAVFTLGVTYGLKYAIEEERPNGGRHSFPSGHSSLSFASAEFMRKRYGWQYGIPAYAAASFVAYSRVEARQHYSHDVIAGAVIGIGSSYLLTREYEGWHMQAEADHKYYGIRMSHIW